MLSIVPLVLTLGIGILVLSAVFSAFPGLMGSLDCPSPSGSPAVTEEDPGQAIVFNGNFDSGQTLTASDSSVHDFSDGSFSFSFWLNPHGHDASDGYIIKKQDTLEDTSIDLYVTSNQLEFSVMDAIDAGNQADSTPVLTSDTWNHVAGVVNRETNTITLYINGSAAAGVGDISGMGSLSNDGLMILGGSSDGNVYLNGTLDDFLVYNTALTQEQVQTIYGGELVQDGLISWYSFNNATAVDDFGNFDLTENNSPTYTDQVAPNSLPEVTIVSEGSDPSTEELAWIQSCEDLKDQTTFVPGLIILAILISAVLILVKVFQG